MKKLGCIIISILMIVLFCTGCEKKEEKRTEITYLLEDCSDTVKPNVRLREDGDKREFFFDYCAASDYVAHGKYKIYGDILTLNAEDGKIFVFKMKDSTIIFDEKQSSELVEIKGFKTVSDKDVFTRAENETNPT